eukprot:UN08711
MTILSDEINPETGEPIIRLVHTTTLAPYRDIRTLDNLGYPGNKDDGFRLNFYTPRELIGVDNLINFEKLSKQQQQQNENENDTNQVQFALAEFAVVSPLGFGLHRGPPQVSLENKFYVDNNNNNN